MTRALRRGLAAAIFGAALLHVEAAARRCRTPQRFGEKVFARFPDAAIKAERSGTAFAIIIRFAAAAGVGGR